MSIEAETTLSVWWFCIERQAWCFRVFKGYRCFSLLSRLYKTNEATFATYTALSYAPSTLSRRCKTPMNFSFQVKRAVMFNISEHRRCINWCVKIVHLRRNLYFCYKYQQYGFLHLYVDTTQDALLNISVPASNFGVHAYNQNSYYIIFLFQKILQCCKALNVDVGDCR